MEEIVITEHTYHVVILATGHTERLLEHVDDLCERLDECEISAHVNLIRYSTAHDVRMVEFDETIPDAASVCKSVPAVNNSGAFIVIDVRDIDGDPASMGTIHIIIEQLSDMGYCTQLDATNIIEELEFTHEKLRYLYVSFDTAG
jgi:hypothetical protein